jgi:hypothetical protein
LVGRRSCLAAHPNWEVDPLLAAEANKLCLAQCPQIALQGGTQLPGHHKSVIVHAQSLVAQQRELCRGGDQVWCGPRVSHRQSSQHNLRPADRQRDVSLLEATAKCLEKIPHRAPDVGRGDGDLR